jgi:hypothetical protein
VLVENPEFAGREPTPLEAVCHDGTPFLTFGCPLCSASNHLHESQIDGLPSPVVLAIRCGSCRRRSELPVRFVRNAFARLRADGWIPDERREDDGAS